MTRVLLAVLAVGSAVTPVAAADPTYPPLPETTADAADLGRSIQRTMTLLATSTPEKRNKVRILFYGQSITEQDWWKQVVADLKRRFPHADIDARNKAIGGFASQLLVRPAEHDLYPFYPDLLIFHVYGAHNTYEDIIRNTRTRTATEVLMQTDHLTRWPPPVVDEKKDKGAWWDDFMNTKFLPATAKKYGCGLVDVRGRWGDYLRANKLEPKALLKDGVHLNDHGNFVMAAIVSRYLVHRPDLLDERSKGLVKETDAAGPGGWRDGTLKLDFDGNRVDLDCGPVVSPVAVRIDGKKPSEFPGCYAITRPNPWPWSKLFLSRVDHNTPLILEDWALTVTAVEDGGKKWAFAVKGSRTGEDGTGRSDKPFVSNSGRVKIDPAAWFPNGGPTVGYTITWSVVPLFADELDPDKTPRTVTVAQRIPNGRHTLELTQKGAGPGAAPVKTVRVYRPPFDPKEKGNQ